MYQVFGNFDLWTLVSTCSQVEGSSAVSSSTGTHSLHYKLTVRSRGGSVQSRFFADCYWDHQFFLHYDSHEKESAKPQELWAEKPLGTESWDTEIQELIEHSKNLKATLAEINAQQEKKGVSPAVNVTCGEALEDTINMTCWAFGFYPQNISVTWLQDGEPWSQGTQQSWGVFPYVNGTYQTWVSIRIPQGQEQRFCCYVGYRGNNSTGLVSCGEPGHSCRSFQPDESVTLGGERGEALRLWYPECNKPAFRDCTAAGEPMATFVVVSTVTAGIIFLYSFLQEEEDISCRGFRTRELKSPGSAAEGTK
uniref:MHC class I polypeptide-related sequence B-like n=1 Tax=Ictidomys tridecemlineatus TaxID=43179 RepID=UPI001A9F6553|nr:MHC class I polypeptide-related sequence B-like [Ictidomys tridecemlineatus]